MTADRAAGQAHLADQRRRFDAADASGRPGATGVRRVKCGSRLRAVGRGIARHQFDQARRCRRRGPAPSCRRGRRAAAARPGRCAGRRRPRRRRTPRRRSRLSAVSVARVRSLRHSVEVVRRPAPRAASPMPGGDDGCRRPGAAAGGRVRQQRGHAEGRDAAKPPSTSTNAGAQRARMPRQPGAGALQVRRQAYPTTSAASCWRAGPAWALG